jgi:formate dehydrogenase major subunit
LRVEGRTVHQVWLPYHWGTGGMVTGDSANDLFGISLDPNVLIQESKVGTCDVRPGRRPTGRQLLTLVEGYQRRSGVYDDHLRPIVTTGPDAERHDDGDATPQPDGGS